MPRTAFDDFFDDQMKDSAFEKAYRQARAEVDTVDQFMRAVESARVVKGISKADLARKSHLQPQTVRRLLTAEDANPTVATVLTILRPMGLGIKIVDREEIKVPKRRVRPAVASKVARKTLSQKGHARRAG